MTFLPAPVLTCCSPVSCSRGGRRAAARQLLAAAGAACLLAGGARAGETPASRNAASAVAPALPPADIPGTPVAPPAGETPPAPAGETPAPPPGSNPWRYIVIHHSASPGGNAAAFGRLHRRKGWDGLAYHFVIDNGKGGPDGRLEVGSRWWQQKHGAHAGHLPHAPGPDERNDYNEFGIGICLVGNLEQRLPTEAQLLTLARLIARLRAQFSIPEENIVGHGNVRSTACPGRLFPWERLFAMMDLTPQQPVSRLATGTVERCPWCARQPDPGYGGTRTAASRMPAPGLPPPIMLRSQ